MKVVFVHTSGSKQIVELDAVGVTALYESNQACVRIYDTPNSWTSRTCHIESRVLVVSEDTPFIEVLVTGN